MNYSLQTSVHPSASVRAWSVSRILSMRARRGKHKVQTIARFYGRAGRQEAEHLYFTIWENLAKYGTIAPVIRRTCMPSDSSQFDDWRKIQLQVIVAMDWRGSVNHKRWIPDGRKLLPAFRGTISPGLKKLVISWYLNNIPRNRALSQHKTERHILLALSSLTTAQYAELEDILYEIESERQQTGKGNNRE